MLGMLETSLKDGMIQRPYRKRLVLARQVEMTATSKKESI